ncbi:transcriptional regulator [Eggerthia catenaformis]
MLFVGNPDDEEYLIGLFHAMFDELPNLKPRKKKK